MNLLGLGERVRQERLAKGWSQTELCRRSGVSRRFLVQVEAGEANPSVSRLAELAGALSCSLTWMLAGLGPADAVDAIAEAAMGLPIAERRKLLLSLRSGESEKVALVGLRGAGKSTVGPLAAMELGCGFIELGVVIEQHAGMSTAEIFEFHGPEQYRRLARAALESVLSVPGALIIEIGGSLVMDAQLFRRLRNHCRVVWLRASPEDHLRRVQEQGDLRPMEGHPDALRELQEILAGRAAVYGQADEVVDTSQTGVDGAVALVTG